MARGNRPDPFDLYYRRDEPLVPRELRFEVTERIDAQGRVITPLDEGQLAGLCRKLKQLDIDSIGIFFMNSYRNPVFEERAAALMREQLPGVYVTVSTDLTREWYEYERCSSVAANAYVGPQVSSYLRRLDGDLETKKFDGSLFMMGSNGGLLSVERTCRQPIALVESGPIGGALAPQPMQRRLGSTMSLPLTWEEPRPNAPWWKTADSPLIPSIT